METLPSIVVMYEYDAAALLEDEAVEENRVCEFQVPTATSAAKGDNNWKGEVFRHDGTRDAGLNACNAAAVAPQAAAAGGRHQEMHAASRMAVRSSSER